MAVSTQRQALSAILFLYRHVLKIQLDWLDDVVRARQPRRPPAILSRDEVTAILSQLQGTAQLVVLLLYGTGMRILECLRLRVQDLDFDLGHKDVKTTMIYTYIPGNSGGRGVTSPADTLGTGPCAR